MTADRIIDLKLDRLTYLNPHFYRITLEKDF